MILRRVLSGVALVVATAGVLALTASGPAGQGSGDLFFSFEEQSPEMSPIIIRRRTITPEFDPPLDVRAGRIVFARGSLACDPGEIFTVEVVITQDGSTARGRTAGRCTGEIQQWIAPAAVRGGGELVEGPAHACAVATTRRGGITDTHEWCADPVLTTAD
jgi:hypothetical protein